MRLKLYRGKWCAVWSEDGDTKRASLGTADKGTAQSLFEDFKTSRARESSPTVSGIVTAYLIDKAEKPSVERMKWAWARLEPHFGHLRADQVTREQCRAFVTKRRKQGRGDNTIRKELTTLRSALNWKDKNTPAVIEMPEMPTPREVFITKEQFDKLVECAKAPHLKLFLMLAWFTAGRKEAILSLTWDLVDFKGGTIDLGKAVGNKGRAKPPISPSLKKALQHAYNESTTDYVIEWAGSRVKSIRKGFDTAAAEAGMSHITPHDLRRSAARRMVERGIPMSEISQYLGHSSTNVTEKVYGRYSATYLRKAAKALE